MKKGKLIVFEGISGTGKETQAKLLSQYLTRKRIKNIIVYHPSPELKEVLFTWRKARTIDHISEIYFLLADCYNRVQQTINPALSRGEWVISLRNFVSALVYQGKTAKDRKYIKKEFQWFEPKPDVLFFFDITPEAAMARIMKRHQETEEPLGKFETKEQLTEKQKKYRLVLRTIPHYVVDATRPIEVVHQEIIKVIHLPTQR